MTNDRSGRARSLGVVLTAGLALAAGGVLAAPSGPSQGPVIAITPNELLEPIAYAYFERPTISARGEIVGASEDGRSSAGVIYEQDRDRTDDNVINDGVAVSGDGCVVVTVQNPDGPSRISYRNRCGMGPNKTTWADMEPAVSRFLGSPVLNHDGTLAAFEFTPDSRRGNVALIDTGAILAGGPVPITRTMPPYRGVDADYQINADLGLAISGDGSVIAAVQTGRADDATDERSRILLWDGSPNRPVDVRDLLTIDLGLGDFGFPSLSGDGRTISFIAAEPGSTRSIAYVADLDALVARQVPLVDEERAIFTSLSRDATQVAFGVTDTRCDENDDNGLEGLARLASSPSCAAERIDVAYGPGRALAAGFAIDTIITEADDGVLVEHRQPQLSGNGRWIAWTSANEPVDSDTDSFSWCCRHLYVRSRGVELSVDPVQFSEITPGSSASTTTVVRNRGVSSVSIDSIVASPGAFTVEPTSSCASLPDHLLAPGATCTVDVHFDAAAGVSGAVSGELTVAEIGYDPVVATAPITASVTTTAPPVTTEPPVTTAPPDTTAPSDPTTVPSTAPLVEQQPEVGVVELSVEPAVVSFGQVPVDTTATPRIVTVVNRGTLAGTVTIGIDGEHAGAVEVTQDRCSGTVLAAGSACTVSLTVTPALGGDQTARLVATSGDASVASALTWQGRLDPRLVASPAAVTRQALTEIHGRGFPAGVELTVLVGDGHEVVVVTDDDGALSFPLLPLGVLELGTHRVSVDADPTRYDEVRTQLVVVLPTFEPQGSGSSVFDTPSIVGRGG